MGNIKKLIAAMVAAIVASCSATPAPAYATPVALVSGAVNKNIKQSNIKKNICIPNYTDTIRPSVSYTNRLKLNQMTQFKLSGKASDYEEDHLIPLSIGGDPKSPDNLWPQPWYGELSAHKKDQLEVRLHTLVCNGSITLYSAQRAIAKDWMKAFDWYVTQKKTTSK